MKKYLAVAAKILIAALLFAAILMSTNWEEIVATASKIHPLTFFSLMGMVLLQAGVLALRWRIITRYTGHTLPLRDSVAGTLTSFFFSQGLPSSVGGDALRIWWLKRRDIPLRDATLSVMLDRIIGLLALLIVCVLSLIILGSRTDQAAFALLSNLLAAAIVIGLGGALLFMVPRRTGASQWALSCAERSPKWLSAIIRLCVELRNGFICLGRNSRDLLKISILGISVHLITVFVGYWVAADLSAQVSFTDCLAVIAPALLISYLPISIAGWGVREGTIVAAFALIGTPANEALLISLMIGASVLATSFIGGAIWMSGGMRDAFKLTTKAEAPPNKVDTDTPL